MRLDLGDFAVTGKNGYVIIERKSAGDYIGSLTSAHLNDQLVRMSQTFKHSAVVIEGSINAAIASSSISRKSVYSSMAGTFLKHAEDGAEGNISLVMVENNWDLALLLEMAQKKMDDPEGLIRPPIITVPQTTMDPRVRMLCCIPGIGENTAKAIIKSLPTIWSVARANEEELKKIKGVGSGLAKTIVRHMRTEDILIKRTKKSMVQS